MGVTVRMRAAAAVCAAIVSIIGMAPPAAAQAAAPDLCRGGFICFYTETSFGGLVESVNSV